MKDICVLRVSGVHHCHGNVGDKKCCVEMGFLLQCFSKYLMNILGNGPSYLNICQAGVRARDKYLGQRLGRAKTR